MVRQRWNYYIGAGNTIHNNTYAGMFITATLELGGLPYSCTVTASSSTDIMPGPENIISANYTTPQALTASVQKFIFQTDLSNLGISQTTFIYIYSGATTSTA